MSSDTVKKRRLANNDSGNGDNMAAAGVEDTITEMKSHMTQMQNKMNDMETRAVSMQNEMNGMRTRLSHIEELEKNTASAQGEIVDLTKDNKFLKAKCSSLERSIKILIDEQKWEYSAPNIPTSHWEERGFDEDYIECMEQFLNKIKEVTCQLRNSGVNDNKWIFLGDEEFETTLLHDDLLLPHWKELANALQLYQEEKPFKLSIFNLQLPASVIDLLAPVLKHESFDTINLQNNSFVNIREGVEFVVEVMKFNDMMEVFCWTSNIINSMEDARYLVDAVNSHPAINTVRLENCFGNDINGYNILCSLLTRDKNFTIIDLDRNNFTQTGGSSAISDYLATNPSLEILCLSDNHLNDDDARLIARALKHNTNLKDIYLDGNDNITEVGCNALSKAVYNPESLNSVADCNHTCKVRGIAFGDIPVNLSGSTPKQNRAGKIYHLLSTGNREGSNVYHLNLEFGDEEEDTLALVPNVLESVHRYSHECVHQRRRNQVECVQPLSTMYEILRSWKVPELYDNCGGA